MIFNTEYYEVFLPPYILIGISVLFSFLVTAVAIPSIVRVAYLKNLMANPNGRTSHYIPTPNLGGVAIFAGVIISSVVFTGITTAHELKYIIAAMLIIHAVKPRFPAALIVIIFSAVVVAVLQLQEQGVLVIGELPSGLPPFTGIPGFGMEIVSSLSLGAVALAAIGLVEAISISRSTKQFPAMT